MHISVLLLVWHPIYNILLNRVIVRINERTNATYYIAAVVSAIVITCTKVKVHGSSRQINQVNTIMQFQFCQKIWLIMDMKVYQATYK